VCARFVTFRQARHFGGSSGIFTNTSADWTIESGDVHREMPAGILSRKRRVVTQPRRAEESGNGDYGSSSCAARNPAASGERQQERDSFEMRLHQREEELRRLEAGILQRISQQLSPSNNRNNDRSDSGNLNENAVVNELGYKLKPDNFDGTAPLREFFSQFELIARANRWNDKVKTIALMSCLRGKARTVLECVEDIESLNYAELKAKLELRFGEAYLAQSYYSLFTNRKQKTGEDEATLGSDIECLSQLAYPECSHQVREKIAYIYIYIYNFKGRKYDSEKKEKVGNKSKENSLNKNYRGSFAKKEGRWKIFKRNAGNAVAQIISERIVHLLKRKKKEN